MTMKELLWNKTVKFTLLGIGIVGVTLITGKVLYDYSMYSNLKYVKKQLKKLNNDNS